MDVKRVVITAGGTGGHLYPAQALAQQLIKKSSEISILFVAGGLSASRFFDREKFSFEEVPCSFLLSANPLKSMQGIARLFKGIQQSMRILRSYRPDVVVGFGSYYTVSTLLAAAWLKRPIILHEANSIPGKANKWLSPLAECIGLHFPSTAAYFKNKTVEVGLPLREGYQLEAVSKDSALSYYGLSSTRRTLLICGGSQGAHAINLLIQGCMPIFQQLSLQVIHLTGNAEMAAALAALYTSCRIQACVKPFEANMQMAWRAADAFIGRSGASTIAEAMEFEVPGILIPYPFSAEQHQEKNADFFVDNVNAGWKLLEPGLSAEHLGERLERLYRDSQYHLFKEALKTYKQRNGRMTLAQLILNYKG